VSTRKTSDPLLKAFLDAYKINLLAIPRSEARVGDAYVDTGKGVSPPGELRYLLTPQFEMPKLQHGEKLTNIATIRTRALELKTGARLLQNFFSAIGLGAAIGGIKAEYEQKGADSVRFGLKNPTRDSVDPFEFSQAIKNCRLDDSNPIVKSGNRYYVALGVVRSSSITVVAEDRDSKQVSVDADALQKTVTVEGKLAVRRDGLGELTYEGSESLAFGVELMELFYDADARKLRLDGLPEPIAGIRKTPGEKEAEIMKARRFIGDPVNGDVFLNILDR
jgi:hypothetical protein